MKKIVFLSLMLTVAAATIPARAQNSLIYIQLGGTITELSVYNNTDDNTPLAVTIGGKRYEKLLSRNASWGRSFGWNYGKSLVVINACRSVGGVTLENIPEWATDPQYVGRLAITQEYLNWVSGDRDAKHDLKDRVKKIKKLLKDRVDLENRIVGTDVNAALDVWLTSVLSPNGLTCQDSFNILSVTDRSQWGWGDRPIVLEVVGNRKDGYHTIHKE